MDLQTYVKLLRKHWRVLPLVTLIFVVAAAAATYLMPRAYESQLQFFVSTVDTSNNNQLAQGSTFLQQRVKSYSQILEAPLVLQPVIDKVGLSETPDQLAKDVNVTLPTDTVLINVVVTDSSAARAHRIATAIGKQFPKVITELETVSTQQGSPVKVTLTEPPTFEPIPVRPRPVTNLAIGLMVGLVVGLGTIMLRDLLDNRVRTRADVEALDEDVAIMGMFPFESDALRQPILSFPAPHSTRAEAFRTMRTNLAFAGASESTSTIVMTSSLPGEGKTTTTANLALVLAESDASVCLVEADLRRPKLLEYFGLEGGIGLTDVLIGRVDLSDVMQPYGRRNLVLLGAGQLPPNPSELLGSAPMRDVLRQLSEKFEYVLIDAPPLLPVTDAVLLATQTDGTVLVVGSGLVTREQLKHSFESLRAVKARILGVAMNKLPRNMRSGNYYGYDYAAASAPGGHVDADLPPRDAATHVDGPAMDYKDSQDAPVATHANLRD